MDRDAWDARYAAADLVWSAGPNQFLVSEVAAMAPVGRAVDVACGEGRNAIWLAGLGWEVTGVDFSPVALAKARERSSAVTWVEADVTTWRAPGAFDLVIVFYLQLPAGPGRTAAFRLAGSAVAPGGTLLIVGHDSSNLEHGWGGPQSPEVLYSPEDVVACLDGLGLDVVKAERVERVVETDDGPRTAIDALVRAVRPARPPRVWRT